VVRDAAKRFGAAYHFPPRGQLGRRRLFQFSIRQRLGGMGERGMNDNLGRAFADRYGCSPVTAMRPRYYHQVVGINSRLELRSRPHVLRIKLRHSVKRSRPRTSKSPIATIVLLKEKRAWSEIEITLRPRDRMRFHVVKPIRASRRPADVVTRLRSNLADAILGRKFTNKINQ